MKQKQLTYKDIAVFSSQIALILQAGITPSEGIAIMNEDNENPDTKKLLDHIYEELHIGLPFYEALASTKMFPDYIVNMIKIGETSGRLEEVMNSLAIHYQRVHENNQNIKSALSYPCIMILMMFVVIIVLMTKVLPIFNQVFEQLGSSLTGFSKMLLNMGMTFSQYSYIFIALLVIFIILGIYFLKFEKGKKQFSLFLTKCPVTRDLSYKLALSQFTSGMSIALSSGLDIEQSLHLSKELVSHQELKQKIEKVENELESQDLTTALVNHQILTGISARLIKIGDKTGHIDTIMKEIADRLDQETNERIQHLISIIEPTLVAILSVFVGIILLSVMLPLMGIMTSL